jgi:hypothetical protein
MLKVKINGRNNWNAPSVEYPGGAVIHAAITEKDTDGNENTQASLHISLTRRKDGGYDIQASLQDGFGYSKSICYGPLKKGLKLFPREPGKRVQALQAALSDVLQHVDAFIQHANIPPSARKQLKCNCGEHQIGPNPRRNCRTFQEALTRARSYLWM